LPLGLSLWPQPQLIVLLHNFHSPSTKLWKVRKEVKVGDCIVHTY